MTHDQFDDAILAMKLKAEAANNAGDWGTCISLCGQIAELTLDHPQFWPKHIDHDQLRRYCEGILARTEKSLGIS